MIRYVAIVMLLLSTFSLLVKADICIAERITVNQLSGYVVMPNGKEPLVLENATVELFSKNNKLLATTKTNKVGYFSFNIHKQDEYILTSYYKIDGALVFHAISAIVKVSKPPKNKAPSHLFITLYFDPDDPCGGSKIEVSND